jgi:hypothetical protein
MTYSIDNAVYAQGWVGGQIADLIEKSMAGSEGQKVMATQLEEQWKIVDTTIDELIRENRDLRIKLVSAQEALR